MLGEEQTLAPAKTNNDRLCKTDRLFRMGDIDEFHPLVFPVFIPASDFPGTGEVSSANVYKPVVILNVILCQPLRRVAGNMVIIDDTEYALPWPGHWQTVVAWPGTRLDTRASRGSLPASYPRATTVAHGAQFASFVHQLYQGEAAAAAQCLVDLLAEPYRRVLLPGFDVAREELRRVGAQATGISGSGPTIFCIVDDNHIARNAAQWLTQNYVQNDNGFVHICRADLAGAREI